MWNALRFGLVLVISAAYAEPEAPESNGAVPGLFSPTMELQFASRMEGKTLLQLRSDIVNQGNRFLNSNTPILGGISEGMKVSGERGKIGAWKVEGLERELGPIRLHIHRITQEFKDSEKLNAEQTKALEAWVDKFDQADAKCKAEPTLSNLGAVALVLLIEVSDVFKPIARPEVKLLESAMMASVLDLPLFQIESYFAHVLNLHKTATDKSVPEQQRNQAAEEIETTSLIIDRVGIHPSVVLHKLPGKEMTGFVERYGVRLKALREAFEAGGGDKKIIERFKALEGSLKDQKFSGLVETRAIVDEVYKTIFNDKRFSPVGLRIQVGLYVNSAVSDPQQAEGLLADLIRLTEETKAQTKLSKAATALLDSALQAMKEAKASQGKSQPKDSERWLKAINRLHLLFKF